MPPEISYNLSREQPLVVANKYFAVSECAHAEQIGKLAETNFVENLGRAKQILSVQCVQTHKSDPKFGWLDGSDV